MEDQRRVSIDELQAVADSIYRDGGAGGCRRETKKQFSRYCDASVLLCSRLGVLEHREWEAYGSGYASFLDSWYYLKEPGFRLKPFGSGERYAGVTVIYSLFHPMFCAFESEREWDVDGCGSSLLPGVGVIDQYRSDRVKALSLKICKALRDSGIPQVSRTTLETPLDAGIAVETNLSNGTLRLFDAFFNWID